MSEPAEQKRPLRSFVNVAPDSHFPIQNLPYGVFRPTPRASPRAGVAIGDYVLDLAVTADAGLFTGPQMQGRGKALFTQPSLNAFMGNGRLLWQEVRATLQHLLHADTPDLRDNQRLRDAALRPRRQVKLQAPVEIGDYTDFYSSEEHAANVGAMFRDPDNALLPNWKHLPVAYHGRASSIVLDETPIRRPQGQVLPDGGPPPQFGPSQQVDFELEVGFFVGPGNKLGRPIAVDDAPDHIFGFVLVNDWSARDIQRWEYRPLGPFLAKNFATSISPWVVTLEALAPFRCPGPVQNPTPLPYLQSSGDWALDIHLEAQLQSEAMANPVTITRTNFRYLYWNVCQQLAHHTITGCNLRPGDLLASGTISGPTPDSYGSLLELTRCGSRPLELPGGETRTFLADGDRLTLTGWCQGEGYRIGFGSVTAQLLSARPV